MDKIYRTDDCFCRDNIRHGRRQYCEITSPVLIIAGDNDGLDKVELSKTYQLLGGDKFSDMGAMPKSHLAIVPGQGHVSLMTQTKIISTYLNDFLK
jgi:pimeloyl-ACP methyl ester carboxylesterase